MATGANHQNKLLLFLTTHVRVTHVRLNRHLLRRKAPKTIRTSAYGNTLAMECSIKTFCFPKQPKKKNSQNPGAYYSCVFLNELEGLVYAT